MTDHQARAAVPEPEQPPAPPTSTPVLHAILRYGLLLAAVIAVFGMALGGIGAGWIGVTSALIGTAMAAVFLSVTALSILIANRFIASDLFVGLFFGIVLGGWIVKFVLFLVLAIVLRDQPWIDPVVLFLSLIAGVIGSLAIDVVVVACSRIPYVSDARLPGEKR